MELEGYRLEVTEVEQGVSVLQWVNSPIDDSNSFTECAHCLEPLHRDPDALAAVFGHDSKQLRLNAQVFFETVVPQSRQGGAAKSVEAE